VHADGDEEDGDECEEEDGVDEDGERAGVEVAELDDPALAGDLEQQARRQQDEEHQRDEHRRPVLHLVFSSPFPLKRPLASCLYVNLSPLNTWWCGGELYLPVSPPGCVQLQLLAALAVDGAGGIYYIGALP